MVKTAIVYPPGSHGNFLGVLLNTLVGTPAENVNQMVYDRVTYNQEASFRPVHYMSQLDPAEDHKVVSVIVTPKSYLKYSAICFNRVSGINLKLEDFETDTFTKLSSHVVYSYFKDSLATIAKKDSGNIEKKDLREWARLCLFDNQGATIKQWLSNIEVKEHDFIFDFEWFYDPETLKSKCYKLLNNLGLTVVGTIDHLLPDFYNNNRYRNIDKDTAKIIEAIKQRQSLDISNTNFLQEGYIDQWLVDTFQVDPLYRNEYFLNTVDLIKQYNL